MVKFILVRHGEGIHNLAARTEGNKAYADPANRDAHLTDKGIAQAKEAGVTIKRQFPKAVALWCSPLTRCIQTAMNIMDSVEVPADALYLHDNLLERQRRSNICNYRAELKDIKSSWPQFNTDFVPDVSAHWVGEEKGHVVKLRMTMLLEHLKRVYAGATDPVIIVCHQESLFEVLGVELSNAEYVITEL
jgi:broad specificity phosphatase PhoE